MRCKTCDYQLWNLTARTCPECGDPFAPSQFEFRPNAVEFRCPHCAQPYYGTTAEGHLLPRSFECVQCHVPTDMDEMVVLPAHGVDPESAVVDQQPWIDRSRAGRRRGWWKTSTLGMFNPAQLARRTPDDAGLGAAWKFTALNLLIVVALTYLMIVAFGIFGTLMVAAGGGGGGGMGGSSFLLIIAGVYAAMFAVLFLLQLLFIAVWIGLTHLFLRITGGSPKPMRATSLSILYTSGAYLPNIIPCVNYISWLWWPITAGIMLKEMQGVAMWRAITATLFTPVLLVVGSVVGYIAFFAWMMSFAAGGNFNSTLHSAKATLASGAVISYQSATGAGPDHALQLVADGSLGLSSIGIGSFSTPPSAIPTGDTTLDQFVLLSPSEQEAIAQAAADALPENVVAHRLGDLVFTHHGFTTKTDFNLWIVVISPDPDANPGQTTFDGSFWVALASGSVEEILESDFDAQLQAQNALRATHDLAPLPHPSDVTHDNPGTGPPAP